MSVDKFNPPELGPTLGAYSHVVTAGPARLVAISGQVGVDKSGELVGPGDCGEQTKQTFANVKTALATAGLGPESVLQTITYLVREEDIEPFFAARKQVFGEMYPDGQYPANTLLIVKRLVQPEFLVEVQALAVGDAARRATAT
jgi:enamine deaminase RidA (YjgF/YER057c/UK114 family)